MKKLVLVAALALLGVGSASANLITVSTSCGISVQAFVSPMASLEEIYNASVQADNIYCVLRQKVESVIGHSINGPELSHAEERPSYQKIESL